MNFKRWADFFSCFIACVVIGVFGGSRKVKVRQKKLDIVLAYDRNGLMKTTGYFRDVYPGIRRWAEYFFKDVNGSTQTQFAVVVTPCYTDPPAPEPLLFTNDKEKIFKEIDSMYDAYTQTSYMKMLAESLTKKILQPDKGDRPDVPNVVFVISSCRYSERKGKADYSLVDELHNKTKWFMFICVPMKLYSIQKHPQKMLDYYTDNDRKKQYNYATYVKFRDHVDKLFDELGLTETIDVYDCEYDGMAKTGCHVINNGTQCVNISYPKVKVHPDPLEYGEECPKNETTDCAMDECFKKTMV